MLKRTPLSRPFLRSPNRKFDGLFRLTPIMRTASAGDKRRGGVSVCVLCSRAISGLQVDNVKLLVGNVVSFLAARLPLRPGEVDCYGT